MQELTCPECGAVEYSVSKHSYCTKCGIHKARCPGCEDIYYIQGELREENQWCECGDKLDIIVPSGGFFRTEIEKHKPVRIDIIPTKLCIHPELTQDDCNCLDIDGTCCVEDFYQGDWECLWETDREAVREEEPWLEHIPR